MIENESIESILKESYLKYAMSVIVSRALPDVRDGLKPVHRRLLYAMYELGNFHNKPYKKSARIVGEVLGKYHPHGDSAIYDSLVRMAQPFSLRYPLVDGQGNFGSVDGDSPAAMRYTEVRMSKIAEEMLQDIEKETVDFIPNFDNTLKEPSVLPAKIPNLLINGSSGIAVGMATNIPPHNLGEIIDALIAIIEGRDEEIYEIVKGPDFPTGALILGKSSILSAYKTGRGIIRVRAKTEIKDDKILITEIPYQVSKAKIIDDIVNAVKLGKVSNIADLHDRSDKRGLLIEIKLKKNANAEVVLNKLFHYTSLEVSFGIINIALVNGVPKLLSLEGMLKQFLLFRFEIIRKRTAFLKKKAEERRHILIGLLKALQDLDKTIEVIKSSKDYKAALEKLKSLLSIDDIQAKSILEMRLNKLISSERDKLILEKEALDNKILEYNEILTKDDKVYEIIKQELLELKSKYSDKRKTEIVDVYEERTVEDLIPNEENVILYSSDGYVKRVSPSEFKLQHRGGKGLMVSGDIAVSALNHDNLLLFTNKAKVYSLKAYEIQKSSRNSKGKHIKTLLNNLEEDEEIVSMISLKELEGYLLFITKNGLIKRSRCELYKNARKRGIKAIVLKEGDMLREVLLSKGNSKILVSTKNGFAIMFDEGEVRESGRTSQGVKAISLANDEVSSSTIVDKPYILFLTSKGFGKITDIENFKLQHRGGKGLIAIKTNSKTGYLRFSYSVGEEDEFLLLTKKGKTIRIKASDVSKQSRYARGVKIINLDEGDEIISFSFI